MLTIRRFEDWQLLVVTYSEPFSGADLIFAANASTTPRPEERKHTCALVDLRSVDVSQLTGSDSRRFGLTKKARLSGQPAEPVAFLLKDMGHSGMLRMHNQWVEAVGLREENDTFTTADPYSALKWIEDRTGQPGLAESLKAHFERTDGESRRLSGD